MGVELCVAFDAIARDEALILKSTQGIVTAPGQPLPELFARPSAVQQVGARFVERFFHGGFNRAMASGSAAITPGSR